MQKILILDFGSQYTQLIARRVRECHVYCEIIPYNTAIIPHNDIKGIILSGSPYSVNQQDYLDWDCTAWLGKVPILAVCYGAQLFAKKLGGTVAKSEKREYGRALLHLKDQTLPLFKNCQSSTTVWMSHADTIIELPNDAVAVASTQTVANAAFAIKSHNMVGVQFHPEVYHTDEGKTMLKNYLTEMCYCDCNWTDALFIQSTIDDLKKKIGDDEVLMGLSGGVDSTVAAVLLHKAIGAKLTCVFVDNGLLRKDEFDSVKKMYKSLELKVIGVAAKNEFYAALAGVSEPEQKRKAIGKTFIDVFDAEAKKINNIKWLGQGTIYPDVIESQSVLGPSATIKSHHNVGGLPEHMKLKIIEPLRKLFKDEVRSVGKTLGIDAQFLLRHPFPGPGLAIRILGEITPNKIEMLQEADAIFITILKQNNWYEKVWQAGVMLLDSKSVGVMGDERTYEYAVALRAVSSTDGMTADWVHLPYTLLADVSNEIINNVKGINRVVYDISSKPPATIEWE